MILHPRFNQLNRFADGDLGARARARIARHLAECTRCRSIVQSIRGISREAPSLLDEDAPAGALESVLARRAAGERIILPSADPLPVKKFDLRVAAAAAAVLTAVAAAGIVILNPSSLSADHSELRFVPEHPTAGATIQVEYRANSFLADNDRLVLRARFRRPNDRTYRRTSHQVNAAELIRDSQGVFRGSVVLPDSTVYAVFAVEDSTGQRADTNGEALWELFAYDGERPSFASLKQRYAELMGRNWTEAARNAKLTAELHPERIESWYMLSAFERWVPGGRGQDSVLAVIADRADSLHGRFADDSSLSRDDVAMMYWVAFSDSKDSEITDFWWNRLAREAPNHPTRVQHLARRTYDDYPDDLDARLDRLEEIWEEYGQAHEFLPSAAYYAASQLGNTRAMEIWKPRVEAMRPWPQWSMVSDFVRHPELREAGMISVRDLLMRLDAISETDRYLLEPVDLFKARQDSARRLYLATLGRALIAEGDVAAGVDTLDLALATGWNADVFSTAAEAKMELGDSAGAIELFSWIAADPTTDSALKTQAESAALAMVDGGRWANLVANGRSEMWQRLLTDAATHASYLDDPSVADSDGDAVPIRALADGRVLLLVLWHYSCGPPGERTLTQVDSLRRRWADVDAEVLVVTDGAPTEMLEFVESSGLDLDLYYDAYGEVKQSFDWWATPSYVVIDDQFRMRYKGDFKPSVRVVEALVAQSRDVASGTAVAAPR